ncbi:MAG: hypothetical protein Q8T11_06940 [Elusimicrobiota bacterium]|nr:hypothetical protein [Elusimicrobiota bacterium]
MSTFLEKNKKKSALAALLLFIRTRKTVTALLLLVALASFLFISPSNLILRFPGGARVAAGVAWMAGKVGVDTSRWGLAGGKRDYSDLLAAFRSAKEGGGKAGWAAFMRGADAEAIRRAAGSTGSLGFVKGNSKDLEAAGGGEANLPKPGAVKGVLNPEDARNTADGEGVALSDEDLTGEGEGLVKSAFAGGFGGGSGAAGGGLSGGSFAGANFFGNGKGAASGKLGDVVAGGLEGISAQPGKGVRIKGGAEGRLSKARASAIDTRANRGVAGTRTISGQRAFVQLASQRGRSAISVAPNCTPGTNCPGEFASVNTGAVYDGNAISGDRTDILTAPQIDGIDTPNLPDSGMADDYIRDAENMTRDAEKCREADDKYGPKELELSKRQEKLSNEFEALGCGQGMSCSKKNKSKIKKCAAWGDQMQELCRESMAVRCDHIKACPLTRGNPCSASECGKEKSKKVEYNEVASGCMDVLAEGETCRPDRVITSSTMDDKGDIEGGSCPAVKADLPYAKQAVQNAIDQYRSNGCVALGQSRSLVDKLAYKTKCAGRENQVVSTCRSYSKKLCRSQRSCSYDGCKPDEEGCKITNLDDIEEFIQTAAH